MLTLPALIIGGFSPRDLYLCLGIAACLFGGPLYTEVKARRRLKRAEGWSHAEGVVTEISFWDDEPGPGRLLGSTAEILYRFRDASGAPHIGRFGVTLNKPGLAEEICRKLAGKPLRVYFNPRRPDDSMLKQDEVIALAWPD